LHKRFSFQKWRGLRLIFGTSELQNLSYQEVELARFTLVFDVQTKIGSPAAFLDI
jgi:hypothetical protein